MIEESLLKSNYLGRDGFIWWIGQVAPAKVWRNEKSDYDSQGAWAYRCKVRIIGYNTFNRNILSDEDLPWAHVMVDPADGSAQGGFGAVHNLTGGETVIGFFLDGEDAQQPVIIGAIYRNENVKSFELKEENEDRYVAFTGHTGNLIQGLTQIKPRNIASLVTPSSSETPPENVTTNSGKKDPPSIEREKEENTGKDQLLKSDAATSKFDKLKDVTIVNENGCENNLIGKITRILQDFIAFVNGIEKYIDVYIDPILNTVIDMTYQVRRFASKIIGVVKFMVNNMRTAIMKLIGCLFSQTVGLFPIPFQIPISEATKNILNIIFCLFEKLLPLLIDFITNLLNNMIGNAINAAACAAEEFTAGILSKLMNLIEELLDPVMSGLDWLIGGLSQISSVLSQASSIANQILSFIGCDTLKCKTPSEWSSRFGPSKTSADNWNRTLSNLNVLKGVNDNIDEALGFLSIFGSSSTPFLDCSEKTKNPKNQKDVTAPPIGVKYSYCLPPEVKIVGDGFNAQAFAVVGNNSGILSIEILNSGHSYSKSPTVEIIDKTNHGSGAKAKSIITNGKVTEIYVTSSGSGYCVPDYNNIVALPTYFVGADRYTLFEGETVNFKIETSNLNNGTLLYYSLDGTIDERDITVPKSGNITINNNTATVTVSIRQDSNVESQEEMIFNLYDSLVGDVVAKTIVIVADTLSPILPPQFDTPDDPPSGDDDQREKPTVGIGTTTPVIGIGNSVVGIVTDVVVDKPGYGYTGGDTINIGICTYTPILTPDGSIIGVINSNCPQIFDTLPEVNINTRTGAGADLYPVIRFTPQYVRSSTLVVNQVGIITVVDCV